MICAGNFLNRQAGIIVMILYMNTANAGSWDIRPRISVAETFTDNVNLDDDNQEYDLITEITPGISARREGGRLRADIDYQMQNLIFLNESGANGSNHQLAGNGTAELARGFFFLDGTASISQAIVDTNDTISNNNVNNAGNRTDTYAYSISPYLQSHFGGYANGTIRYRYGQVFYDDSRINETTQESYDANFVSGRKFGPLSWTANANHTTINEDGGDDDEFRNAEANARYRISGTFSLIGTAGYANNDFDSSDDDIENGSYWAIGGFIQPSPHYSLEAQQGNNLKTAAVNVYPTRRTQLNVTYRDRDVGLNPGENWRWSFSHYTRRTTWQAQYTEDTTTETQQVLEDGGTSSFGIDPLTGEVNPDPQPGDLVVEEPIGPIQSLTNEVVERKRGSGTFGMKGGKTSLRFTIFEDRREYQSSGIEERTRGFSYSVNRRLAPRTNGILSGTYQRNRDNRDGGDLEDVYGYIRTDVTRQISRRATGSLGYQFQWQDSNEDRNDYTENRIEARLTVLF